MASAAAAAGEGQAAGGLAVINMWSTPRTLSTALMYSFHQRPDAEATHDEPLYAHHLTQCPHLADKRPYVDQLFQSQCRDGNAVVRDVMLAPPASGATPGTTRVRYLKHMAKHIVNLDLAAFLGKTHNVLLIRDPVYMLTSWANKLDASMEETGYAELLQLYSEIERATGKAPIVVDSDELQRNPEAVLRELCARLGIPFYPEQLRWPQGPKACNGVWASHWYDRVHASTGFNTVKDNGSGAYRHFPRQLFPLLRMCQPFYQALAAHAIRPSVLSSSSSPPSSSSSSTTTTTTTTTTMDHGLPRRLAPDPENLDILVWVGGRLLPRELAKVSVLDSSVQGGDAVWEGLRVYDGRVFKLEAHLQRLMDSAKAMDFKNVPSKAEVRHALFATLAANGMRDGAHVRLTLSRGLKTTSSMNPKFNVYGCCLIVLAEHKPVGGVATYDNEAGIKLVTAANRRNPPQCVDSKIHHNNLINNILAKIQANYAGAEDAIMLDVDGFVSETNATNLFLVKNGAVLTPHADHCLPGITRQTVIDLVRTHGLPLVERRVSLAEFHAADEVFTTGTMGELSPVAEIDGRAIGHNSAAEDAAGVRWPVTRRIQAAYRTLTEAEGEQVPF